MEHKFVVMWCNEGLEAVVDITQIERQQLLRSLSSGNGPSNGDFQFLNHMMMRARMNTQRHYEIYLITAVDGITKEDITEMFDNSPQTSAETIREIGKELYSDRATKKPLIS